jgi:hypothetical protein
MSEPIAISREGWNKVLQIKNGNTVLFHFENRKPITVKIFDKARKEIASQEYVSKLVDVNALERSHLDGVAELGDEAVLFITQDIDNKETLVRIRFNSTNAKLVAEQKVIQSASFQKKTTTRFLKLPQDETYTVVAAEGKSGFAEKKVRIEKYGNKHELTKTVIVSFEQKGYDEVNLIDACIDIDGGVLAAVELSKIIQYPNLHEKFLLLAYLAKDADSVKYTKVALPNSFSSYQLFLTNNSFAQSLNVLLSANSVGFVENGLNKQIVSFGQQSVLIVNSDFSGQMAKFFENNRIRQQVYLNLDTNYDFNGHARKMHTNKYGLSTVIYSGMVQSNKKLGWAELEGSKKVIGVLQYNDKGEEVFGYLVPLSWLKHPHQPYQKVFHTSSLADINDIDGVSTKNNHYILFNELEGKFNQSLKSVTDSLFNCYQANPVCYRLNRKKEMTATFLFGKPEKDDYKQIYAGSGDYNETSGSYTTVLLHSQGSDRKTRIAWVQLEP